MHVRIRHDQVGAVGNQQRRVAGTRVIGAGGEIGGDAGGGADDGRELPAAQDLCGHALLSGHGTLDHERGIEYVASVEIAGTAVGTAVGLDLVIGLADVTHRVAVGNAVRPGVVGEEGEAVAEAVLDGNQQAVISGVAAIVDFQQAADERAVGGAENVQGAAVGDVGDGDAAHGNGGVEVVTQP